MLLPRELLQHQDDENRQPLSRQGFHAIGITTTHAGQTLIHQSGGEGLAVQCLLRRQLREWHPLSRGNIDPMRIAKAHAHTCRDGVAVPRMLLWNRGQETGAEAHTFHKAHALHEAPAVPWLLKNRRQHQTLSRSDVDLMARNSNATAIRPMQGARALTPPTQKNQAHARLIQPSTRVTATSMRKAHGHVNTTGPLRTRMTF